MKCRGLTRLKKMWFILLGQTTQKAMPQGGQPLKQHYDGTLHSLWHFDWHCSLGWRCCDVEVYAFIGEINGHKRFPKDWQYGRILSRFYGSYASTSRFYDTGWQPVPHY
jgi:hypothetical protein